jgi:diaminopimelate decarboxylase
MFTPKEIQFFNEKNTPFFYYRLDILEQVLEKIKSASEKYGYIIHYAVKANANAKILQTIQNFGFGADCVSGNEIEKATGLGFSPGKITFAGVGKTDSEIKLALNKQIFSFNCESIQEIEVIDDLARETGTIGKIAIRINPNVKANTHHYITTGIDENKFGINRWEFDKVLELIRQKQHIKLVGLHFHIGSQITDFDVFKNLCIRVNEIQHYFIENKVLVEHINVGGGLGVDYEHPDRFDFPDYEAFFKLFNRFLDLLPGQKLHFELGRAVVAQSGDLISKVLFVKSGIHTNFAIIDAGMTELIRPALYQAYHKIENISSEEGIEFYDVVGPICESSDTFGKTVQLTTTRRGDLIAIRTAGAYGQVMSSQYNLRNLAPAYYSDEIDHK